MSNPPRRAIDEAITPPFPPDIPQTQGDAPPPDQIFAPGTPFPAAQALPSIAGPKRTSPGRGRRNQSVAAGRAGHAVGAMRPSDGIGDIAVAATLRAAAFRRSGETRTRGRENADVIALSPHRLIEPLFSEVSDSPSRTATSNENFTPPQPSPNRGGSKGLPPREGGLRGGFTEEQPPIEAGLLQRSDLRVKMRRARTGNLILFVVDASGSMGARKRMVAVKGAILSLLIDAYQKRDRVGLITFRGQGAEVLVSPTNSVELAERSLRQMPTGGQTPLAAGLRLARQTLELHLKRDAALAPLLVLVTDGRANVGQPAQIQQAALGLSQLNLAALVLDSEQGFVRLGAAQEIAHWLDADYVRLDDLRSETITQRVRQRLNP